MYISYKKMLIRLKVQIFQLNLT